MPRHLVFAFCLFTLTAPAATVWAAQARGLPPQVLEKKLSAHLPPKPALAFNDETVTVVTPFGVRIKASLRVPNVPGSREFPVLLVFGGFEQAAQVLQLIHPKDPMILASFDYPFAPAREFHFPESFKFAPEAKQAVRDTIAGIDELVHILEARLDVDKERITVLGASFGGPFAIAAASREPAISGLVLVHAFGDVPGTAAARLEQVWAPRFGRLGFLARPVALAVAWLSWLYLDAPKPEDEIARMAVNQRILLVSAESDTFVPRGSSGALWQAIQNSVTQHDRVVMPGDHLQPGSGELIEKIAAIATEWMRKKDLL